MEDITPNKAFRKGWFQVRLWPSLINVLALGLIIYLVFFAAVLAWLTGLIIVLVVAIVSGIWSLRQIGRWKLWMVKSTNNPKTANELAEHSFIPNWKRKVILWTPAEKHEYKQRFDTRMEEWRETHLKLAKEKYEGKKSIVVTYSFGSLFWLLLLELLTTLGVAYFFMKESETTIKVMLAGLVVLLVVAILYTIRTIWRRNTTVLEITPHGIRIEDEFYGWLELEHIDIVRGEELLYKKHGGIEESLPVHNLSLSGEYLDELILFYRNQSTGKM